MSLFLQYLTYQPFADVIRMFCLRLSNTDICNLILTCQSISVLCIDKKFWLMKLRKEYPFVWNYHEKVPISNPKSLYVRQLTWVDSELIQLAKNYFPEITQKQLKRFIRESKEDVENDTANAKLINSFSTYFVEYCALLVRIRYRNSIYGLRPI